MTDGADRPGEHAAADAVERRLRGLDRDALAALVAELWAARGFDTARENGVVVARREGRAASLTLYPMVAGRLRGRSPPDRPVDVVVAPRGGRAADEVAAARDARLLGAADLRAMLFYAVDRERREALCERHLGGPPTALESPPGDRLRNGLRSLSPSLPFSPPSAPGTGRSARAVPARAGVLVALAVVAGLAVLALGGGGGVAGPASGPDLAALADGDADGIPARPTPGAVPTDTPTPTPAALAPDRLPPGVTAAGLADPATLAAAHREAVANGSYTVWMDFYRPRNGDPSAPRVQRDVDVYVEHGRYGLVASVEDDDGRRTVQEVYFDGAGWSVADRTGVNVTYRRVPANQPPPHDAPNPLVLERSLVDRYLSDGAELTGTVARDGRTLYRLVGTGPGPGGGDGTVVALVDRQGFVRHLAVEYAVATDTARYEVRFEASYARVGRTAVDPPPWCDRATGDAAGTGDGDGDGNGSGDGK